MKKLSFILMAVCFIFSMASPSWAASKAKDVTRQNKIIKKTTKKIAPVKKQLLSDLIVSNIVLIKDCKIKITIKNIGQAGVPDIAYHTNKGAVVQMYKNSAPWGGIRLGAIDPAKKLKTPGASVSYIWFPGAANLDLGPGIHSIKVIVDNNNAVKESNENNNTLTRRLTCESESKPDLIVTDIRVVKDCWLQVTLKNAGTAGLPSWAYSGPNTSWAAVQMLTDGGPWGGMALKVFDPTGKLKTPGASVTGLWFKGSPGLELPPGLHSVKVIVDVHNKVDESNDVNNTLTRRLTCESG